MSHGLEVRSELMEGEVVTQSTKARCSETMCYHQTHSMIITT